MLGLLFALLVLLIIFAIVWVIVKQIPVPAPYAWIPPVVIGLIFLICVIELLMGGFAFPWMGHSLVR